MPVKGLLVKFVGPHQRTGQSPLSQKWSAACYWGKAVSPEIFSICVLMGGGGLCVRN